jgi:DNA helicase-2/ATP-dependent DNA helicase PcrA
MIVGDPAQSIFGFRCSSPEIMRSFADQWHGAKVFRLSKNYRSGKSIVSAANGVLRGMKDKLVSAEIVAVKSHRSSVECASFNWNTDEAVAISENLLAHHAEGFSWKDQAVLFRSRWQSEEVQKALEKANVPYRAVGEDSSQKVWPAGSRTSDRVTLSTIHAAKGREWKVVYLLGCSENLFPLDRGSVDEDRRLFYVAVTRATDELWISSSSHSASRFISESGISCHGWDPIGPRTDPNAVVGEQLSLI